MTTLAELHAQLTELRDEQRAHRALELPEGATVDERLAAHAEWAERQAVLAERERDLWSEVAVATYATGLGEPDPVLALLRDAVITASGHVAPAALEARRHADGTARHLAAVAAERRAGGSA